MNWSSEASIRPGHQSSSSEPEPNLQFDSLIRPIPDLFFRKTQTRSDRLKPCYGPAIYLGVLQQRNWLAVCYQKERHHHQDDEISQRQRKQRKLLLRRTQNWRCQQSRRSKTRKYPLYCKSDTKQLKSHCCAEFRKRICSAIRTNYIRRRNCFLYYVTSRHKATPDLQFKIRHL